MGEKGLYADRGFGGRLATAAELCVAAEPPQQLIEEARQDKGRKVASRVPEPETIRSGSVVPVRY